MYHPCSFSSGLKLIEVVKPNESPPVYLFGLGWGPFRFSIEFAKKQTLVPLWLTVGHVAIQSLANNDRDGNIRYFLLCVDLCVL